MNKKIVLLFVFLFSGRAFTYGQVTFIGTAYNSPKQKVWLRDIYTKKVDSAIIDPKNPTFILHASANAESLYMMQYEKSWPYILNQFIVTPGEHVIFSFDAASKERFKWITVSGSPFTAERVNLFKNRMPYKLENEISQKKIDSIRQKDGDTSEIVQLQRRRVNNEAMANDIARRVFDTTKSALNSSFIYSSLSSSFLATPNTKDSLLKILQARFPDNKEIQLLGETLTTQDEGLDLNTQVPDIRLKDLNGNEIDMKTMDYQYLLIDFWASWCKPCRIESPGLVKTYAAFKDKGFKIMSVSIDADSTKWKQAIKEDFTGNFVQVDDPTAGHSIYLKQYKLNYIPYNFIIDRSGNIIAKNLRGDDLYKAVKKLLKSD